jgi:hypothetical protein
VHACVCACAFPRILAYCWRVRVGVRVLVCECVYLCCTYVCSLKIPSDIYKAEKGVAIREGTVDDYTPLYTARRVLIYGSRISQPVTYKDSSTKLGALCKTPAVLWGKRVVVSFFLGAWGNVRYLSFLEFFKNISHVCTQIRETYT